LTITVTPDTLHLSTAGLTATEQRNIAGTSAAVKHRQTGATP
jgi:hypothetical protein